ncbi:hypothetical protein P154DRAFT_519329, partial [Amniculicola lignicola CBS 123094]
MAPKGGKGGGGGGGGGGKKSITAICPSDATYPCNTDMYYIYGDKSKSLFTQSALYGQLVLYIIFAALVVGILVYSHVKKTKKTGILKTSLYLFFAAWVFECTRWGLIIAESSVPIGYRFESSVVILLWRLAMPTLFAAVQNSLQTSKIPKIGFYVVLLAYTILNMAYIVLDFLLSASSLEHYKETWEWRLSDRDFGLTYSAKQIRMLVTTSSGASGLDPYYVLGRVNDEGSGIYQRDRGLQVKLGVVADFLALALATYMAVMVGLAFVKKKGVMNEIVSFPIFKLKDVIRNRLTSDQTIHVVAASGLLLSTLFRVVVATAFVLPNWRVVSNTDKWVEWIVEYFPNYDPLNWTPDVVPQIPEKFLEGYRLTANGFPIAQALLEPLGIVLAAAAVVYVAVVRERRANTTYQPSDQEQKWGQH